MRAYGLFLLPVFSEGIRYGLILLFPEGVWIVSVHLLLESLVCGEQEGVLVTLGLDGPGPEKDICKIKQFVVTFSARKLHCNNILKAIINLKP